MLLGFRIFGGVSDFISFLKLFIIKLLVWPEILLLFPVGIFNFSFFNFEILLFFFFLVETFLSFCLSLGIKQLLLLLYLPLLIKIYDLKMNIWH